ncbi:DUF4435 domain-containing protein [Acetobacter pasteurianus]|uniref:DUF4435 domain-containing protein n=1 Tax=Acetobacter pasteurianus (strain NBRC 105184 / IFO 3283-01) TaxID=634452 RepID=C7JFG1_ACEP3|nr:DUF4435 domain-containing protein [Acetobacter pasteurianus]BAH98982.1 hypothetical protein APA01_08340 [Acetobacter pasteurianus IFO 3283-01]BAI02033.1 hypothetical protein APA03_08340 [Acetobacter pasteurianus IFO 3283-03]BAI05081.1 hypothetical protein APA07_08340 [Acetobacter pasteurianus IFO 3283-07]BAI08128.1 hypothetical protein APA22_08340 [Acetobacter pasteurianus IFO 3283-22]BAI11176.1 hypothetical protein APA26_08340 [Acetobacter pasteurianus IFO 3283-26]
MNSITRHLTPQTIYAQIRMERQTHRGVFFLMEGSQDFRRFDKFLERTLISVIPCSGKDNLQETIDISQNEGYEDCLGFVDNDFDIIEGCATANEDVIRSLYHDFEMDVCNSEAIKRYLDEVAIPSKVAAEGGCATLILSLLELLRPLSALRYANVKHDLRYNLRDLQLYKFFDGHTLDINAMIDEASQRAHNNAAAKQVLRTHINRYAAIAFDLWQFTNGHDLVTALGIALQKRIGKRVVSQTTRNEVEKHLRLTFDYNDFHSCGLAKKIENWGKNQCRLGLLKKIA